MTVDQKNAEAEEPIAIVGMGMLQVLERCLTLLRLKLTCSTTKAVGGRAVFGTGPVYGNFSKKAAPHTKNLQLLDSLPRVSTTQTVTGLGA